MNYVGEVLFHVFGAMNYVGEVLIHVFGALNYVGEVLIHVFGAMNYVGEVLFHVFGAVNYVGEVLYKLGKVVCRLLHFVRNDINYPLLGGARGGFLINFTKLAMYSEEIL